MLLAGLCGCAAAPTGGPHPDAGEPEQADPRQGGGSRPLESGANPESNANLEQDGDGKPPLLDLTQQRVFTVVNSTSQWFDGFFGSPRLNQENDEEAEVTRGLLAVGAGWDERDELDGRLRLRAQFPLPALKRRTRLLLGRGDTQDLVDGSETETISGLPGQFGDFADDDWLLGLGYREGQPLENGWDFSLGASFSSGAIDPYVRATYHWHRTWGESWLWRLRPRVFWQEQRGEGVSLNSILDYVVNPAWLLRSWITMVSDGETEGMGWTAEFLAYQNIDERTAVSWRAYATGATRDPVELQDYGFEIRYRRRILREWLYLELSSSISWPRELLIERRASNLGIGVELEMQFGDWPGREQQVAAADR